MCPDILGNCSRPRIYGLALRTCSHAGLAAWELWTGCGAESGSALNKKIAPLLVGNDIDGGKRFFLVCNWQSDLIVAGRSTLIPG